MNPAQSLLVSSWLALQHARRRNKSSPEREELSWATGKVWEMCNSSPDEAWEFIVAAWCADQSPVIAENLSAGPLEDLLAKHGDRVIDRVETEARKNPSLSSLLGGVWRSEIAETVWARVLAIRDRRGWDGIPAANGGKE
ncbi:DUF6869 domain-containing protein [Pinirhizobacter soli]|uniref:DUF6869 domain-containing protein n=1 Tax=Pinirhizobacter soli TaxID=2786953 RepID=UPI003CCCCD1A